MMKNVRTRMQQTVLDVFPEKKNLSAAEVLTLLRASLWTRMPLFISG